jgi:hypothetical protein
LGDFGIGGPYLRAHFALGDRDREPRIAMPTQIAEDFMVSSPSKLSDIFFVNGPDRPLEVEPAPSFAAMQDKSMAMQTDSQTNSRIHKDSTVGVL